ncbi:alpha/beta hydrolase fold [Lentzea fradiae]|uniref:Alpha/beta hydrolase fold n=1 Tax=Lentzea fradiae TaxID=200378 RepID=A0A1G8C9F5_9PSEU|nr:alpha/beta hydrolase [Lentzea fradiae]SDH42094.1 alpha/beta hydrolase fold [Lentzea fradiae]
MTKRRSRVTAALFALIIVLGTSTSFARIDGSPVAARKGLERFYAQALSWGACQPYATDAKSKTLFEREGIQCARLQVPLDYAQPDVGTVTVALLRRPATEPGRKVGSLVVNPGGPGGSGMAHVANMQAGNPVGKRFDVVGFDPRGVGASQPRVLCLTDAERDAQRLRPKGETADAVEAENKFFVEKCAQRSGIDLLRNVGTRDVARDVDVLRAVLGDKKLSYLGYSYGTRLGALYAEMFPRNVRAMVLDGAVELNGDKVAASARQAQGFEESFQRFASWCAQRDCPIGTDTGTAESKFRQMIEPLKKTPLQVGDRKLSHSDANTAIIQAMYSDRLWETALKGLQELRQNKGTTLLQLADQYLGRAQDGTYSRIQDAFVAIRCVDEPPVKDRATLESNRRRLLELLGNDTVPSDETALGPCAFWPAPHTSEPRKPVVKGLPQVLVVSTTGDPATPYQSGVDLAQSLGARLLTYNGNQHTAFLAGIGCVDGVATNYLADLRLPETDVVC